MINLLPDENKKQLRAARSNTVLIKCLLWTLASATFLILICIATYFILNNTNNQGGTINDNSALNASYDKAKIDLEDIKSKISYAENVLNHQIPYSNIILGIASSLPNGVILEKLSLSDNIASNPTIILNARAKSIDSTAAMKDNFSKISLFSNYSQTVVSETTDSSAYPVSLNINIDINKNGAL
jgi:Tfp pilus assembly protein PilN